MTDMRNEMDSDLDQNYSLNSNVDPKNMQELTIYVSFFYFCQLPRTQYNNKNNMKTPQRPTPQFPALPVFSLSGTKSFAERAG